MRLAKMIGHEARQLASDRALVATLLILGLAIAYGIANGTAWVAFQRRVLAEVGREDRARVDRLRALIAADPDRGVAADAVGSNLGVRHASLPPGPLAPLVVGQSDLDPFHVLVSTATRPSAPGEDEIENPTHLLTGRFDLGFVIVAIYPLVILALSYNILAAEKEGGTLVLILVQPVRLSTLVVAKTLARGAAVLGLAVVLSLVGALVAGGSEAGDGPGRLGLWLAVVAVYGAFWFALAVAVNAAGGGSARNSVILAGTWLVLVAIVPAAANALVREAYPVPSRVELTQAIREAADEARAQGPKLGANFLEAHPELVRDPEEVQAFAVQTLAVQEATEAGVAAIADRFATQLGMQQSLVDRFCFVSPAIVALEALEDVAGTGSARSRRFAEQVEVFRARWRDAFRPRIVRGEPIRAAELDQLPRFTFREEPLAAVAGRVGIGLAGMLVPTVGLAIAAALALRRFAVVG